MGILRLDRILFATDFSSDCEPAFRYATALAQRFNARLYVLHVLPEACDKPGEAGSLPVVPPADQWAAGPMHRLRQELLAGYDDYMIAAIPGPRPAQRIVEKARELRVDLIVLGAHHGAPPPLVHDVVQEVCEASPCPVVCVPCSARRSVYDEDHVREW